MVWIGTAGGGSRERRKTVRLQEGGWCLWEGSNATVLTISGTDRVTQGSCSSSMLLRCLGCHSKVSKKEYWLLQGTEITNVAGKKNHWTSGAASASLWILSDQGNTYGQSCTQSELLCYGTQVWVMAENRQHLILKAAHSPVLSFSQFHADQKEEESSIP